MDFLPKTQRPKTQRNPPPDNLRPAEMSTEQNYLTSGSTSPSMDRLFQVMPIRDGRYLEPFKVSTPELANKNRVGPYEYGTARSKGFQRRRFQGFEPPKARQPGRSGLWLPIPVAKASDCLDQLRILGVTFNLPAHVSNVNPDYVEGLRISLAPHMAQQLVLTQDLPRALRQHPEKPELGGAEVTLPAPNQNLPSWEVDGQL